MKWISLITGLAFICGLFLSCSKDNAIDGTPAPGSSRTLTSNIEYVSGKIEGSSSWATWPVAIFASDINAVKYSVKVLKSGKIYSWNAGEATQSEYRVYAASNDLKDGKFYVGLGRTWCSECTSYDESWEQNYRAAFASADKVEVTFYY